MSKVYTITWEEHKFCSVYKYFSKIVCESREEAKVIYFAEQSRRRFNGLPHMFHAKIGLNLGGQGRTYKQIKYTLPSEWRDKHSNRREK